MRLQGPGRHAVHSSADDHAGGAVSHGGRPGLQHVLCTDAWHHGIVSSTDRCNMTSEPATSIRMHCKPTLILGLLLVQGMIYTQARSGPMFMQPGLHHAAPVGRPVFMQPANASAQTPPAPRYCISR